MDALGRAGLLPNLLQAVLVEQAIAPIALTPDEAEQAEADFCHQGKRKKKEPVIC
jgi:hypothetical protein